MSIVPISQSTAIKRTNWKIRNRNKNVKNLEIVTESQILISLLTIFLFLNCLMFSCAQTELFDNKLFSAFSFVYKFSFVILSNSICFLDFRREDSKWRDAIFDSDFRSHMEMKGQQITGLKNQQASRALKSNVKLLLFSFDVTALVLVTNWVNGNILPCFPQWHCTQVRHKYACQHTEISSVATSTDGNISIFSIFGCCWLRDVCLCMCVGYATTQVTAREQNMNQISSSKEWIATHRLYALVFHTDSVYAHTHFIKSYSFGYF